MKTLFLTLILIIATITTLLFSGFRNVKSTKEAAPLVWNQAGFEVGGYTGYNWSLIGGGDVWHVVTRKETPGVTYEGYISKWGNEYHVYHIRAIDAIQPDN